MVPRPRLALLHPPRPRPGILASLLQPTPTPHLTRRPTTHQPRSPRPEAGHLAPARPPLGSKLPGLPPRARLAALAHVGPPPRRPQLAHGPAAAHARLALAQVDQEAVLERAADPFGVAEVVDGGALRLDAELERLHHRVAQRARLLAVDAVGAPERVDARAEERLVGVDVADARDPLLVEQHRLDRGAAVAGQLVQALAGELGLERLDAEALGEEVVERLRAERELAGAEPARVDELQLRPLEGERHACVGRALVRVEQQRAGHPQVQQQVRLVLELPPQVLAAAAEPLDAAALDRGGELLRGGRERPSGVVDLEPLERAAVDVRREVAADGLDLGQLGHDTEARGSW